ncbi:response regulator transcription factor [Sphingomicrobium sp. XHP0235]|uniref:response regulator transcription factor n=1 Tax=Sphingomicrobium aquimarinum TaxID=3133971 RepID=UPI0031FEE7DE
MARIIIVDDDPMTIDIVRATLEKDGHIVGALPDGSSVADVAVHKRPDLMILDCSMPYVNGIDALREVRRSTNFDLPILMLTGRTSASDERIAFHAGADDYLRKPFDPDQLSIRVAALLDHQQRGAG